MARLFFHFFSKNHWHFKKVPYLCKKIDTWNINKIQNKLRWCQNPLRFMKQRPNEQAKRKYGSIAWVWRSLSKTFLKWFTSISILDHGSLYWQRSPRRTCFLLQAALKKHEALDEATVVNKIHRLYDALDTLSETAEIFPRARLNEDWISKGYREFLCEDFHFAYQIYELDDGERIVRVHDAIHSMLYR